MANYVYIAKSLDGFIATSDGEVEWLNEISNPEHSDFGFSEFISKIDAIVMGRNTYEKVLSFGVWPYEKPVFVLSNTLTKLPDASIGKAEIMKGKPREIVSELKDRGFNNLYIDGGNTIQNFLSVDLIDEMIITTIPILLGEGIPLFGKLAKNIKFDHVKTQIVNDSLVMSHYTRLR
jgi:dihydrofolate reductase